MINDDIAGGLIQELFNSVAIVYQWDGFYQPEHRSIVQPRPDTLTRYTGVYAPRDRDTASIDLKGDQLYFISRYMTANHPERIYFTSPVDFFIYEENFSGYFKDGRLYVKRSQGDQEFLRQDESVKFKRDF